MGISDPSIGTQTLTYHAAGQITGLTDSNSGSQTFGYDDAGRLTSFTASGGLFGAIPGLPTSQAFTYDAAGNRTTLKTSGDFTIPNNGTSTYVIASNSNRIQSITSPTLTAAPQTRKLVYDAAGNIIHDGKRQFSYDARNRMASSRVDETEAVYGYNSLGQRTMKTNGAMTEWSVYDNAGRLANLQRTTEATQQEFVYLGLQPIAMLETDQACRSTNATNAAACATSKVTYLWADHLGTPRRATDATTNQIVWSWDSAPFGETPAQVDPKNTGTKTNITLRFPGQQYDSDTNLHYNQQRDYNPKSGRYVQADPIGLAGGMNVYSYTSNKPVLLSDSNGTDPYPDCPENGSLEAANCRAGLPPKPRCTTSFASCTDKCQGQIYDSFLPLNTNNATGYGALTASAALVCKSPVIRAAGWVGVGVTGVQAWVYSGCALECLFNACSRD